MNSILSVCLISYNHEDFIEDALKGIIYQKTSFPFELVISDDASGDRTNEIILKVTENIPQHVTLKYFHHKQNLGMYANFEFALNACSGEYIAVCEGDDYWIEDEKLQMQLQFLNENPDYNLITAHVRQYFQNDGKFVEPHHLKAFTFDYKDMIVKNHCSTCTTMFRNFIKNEGPMEFIPKLGCDFQIWMRALGKRGKGIKLDVVFAVYRRHENSATGLRNKKLSSYSYFENMVKEKIRIAESWNHYFGCEASDSVLRLKVNLYKSLAKVSYNRNKFFGLLFYYFQYRKSQLLFKFSSLL
ncbi:MAG: glycosyltransferase [Gelidibacter sp.]